MAKSSNLVNDQNVNRQTTAMIDVHTYKDNKSNVVLIIHEFSKLLINCHYA